MDSKSRLPKPSGSRPPPVRPLTETQNIPKPVELNPAIHSQAIEPSRFLRRRSKSVAEFRPRPFISNPTSAAAAKEPMPTTSRGTTKRPAAKSEDEMKPKVTKQAKVPNWDYKNRFQMLNEKHTNLLETYRNLKSKIVDLEDLEDKYNKLTEQKDTLEKNYSELSAKESQQAKELGRLKLIEQEYEKLKTDYEMILNTNTGLTNEKIQLKLENEKLDKSLKNEVGMTETLSRDLCMIKQDVVSGEMLRRKLHNTIQDLKGNIRVFCRVRPPINREEFEKLQCLISFPDENTLDIRKSKESISAVTRKPVDCKAEFVFDRVFRPEATQAEFFEELSQLVQSALDGYDVCVFAYGQTGSGKTYTMQGEDTPEHLGMVPRAIGLIFQTIESLRRSNWEYEVKVSFLEIYNECVRDLLDPNLNRSSLDILYNEGRGITVPNLNIKKIYSPKEFDKLRRIAQNNRMVATTNFNEHSSRSHAVYKIYLHGSNQEYKCSCSGSVNLVDLAGSESAKTSSGERLVETKSINTSLSVLGNVMLALYNKGKHIPYRNSKLTYLLQSSLGGNSKTLMVVNISPFEEYYQESLTSLRFASKVKEVKTSLKRNKALLTPQASTSFTK